MRQAIRDGHVHPHFVPSAVQIADISTKPLAAPQFELLRPLAQGYVSEYTLSPPHLPSTRIPTTTIFTPEDTKDGSTVVISLLTPKLVICIRLNFLGFLGIGSA